MKKTVIFCGGGSGGHVLPALTLIHALRTTHPEIECQFIGSYQGIEKTLTASLDLPYKAISTGKLRRYFSWQNFTDLFRLAFGLVQAFLFLVKLRLDGQELIVFSTGGFVTVPVALAAKLSGVPFYLHEQTTRAGLANRLCAKFATKAFLSFEESRQFFPKDISLLAGYPLREECFTPAPESLSLNGEQIYPSSKPLLFITGGGNGSALINDLIEKNLSELLKSYKIVHQVGAQFLEKFSKLKTNDYHPFSFIGAEMLALMKLADIVISRAGAGTVAELLALQKRSYLIPLKIAQKNEQYHNAMVAVKELNSFLIEEDQLKEFDLLKSLESFTESAPALPTRVRRASATDFLVGEIESAFRNNS